MDMLHSSADSWHRGRGRGHLEYYGRRFYIASTRMERFLNGSGCTQASRSCMATDVDENRYMIGEREG